MDAEGILLEVEGRLGLARGETHTGWERGTGHLDRKFQGPVGQDLIDGASTPDGKWIGGGVGGHSRALGEGQAGRKYQ